MQSGEAVHLPGAHIQLLRAEQMRLAMQAARSKSASSCTARSELPLQSFLRFGRSTAPAPAHAQQPAHSPDDENQYRNRDNCGRQKVVSGIGENVIRMSRVKAIEAFKDRKSTRLNSSHR